MAGPQGIEPCQPVLETGSPALGHWGLQFLVVLLLSERNGLVGKTKRPGNLSVARPLESALIWDGFLGVGLRTVRRDLRQREPLAARIALGTQVHGGRWGRFDLASVPPCLREA